MQSMFINDEISTTLLDMGMRLRQARITRGDTQLVFAKRLSISVPTLRALEGGDPHVSMGVLSAALWALSRLNDLASVMEEKRSLFDIPDKRPMRARTRRKDQS